MIFEYFVLRALVACAALSAALAPLGCFLLWRQQAFFGEAMAHSALLGIALALLFQIAPLWGVLIVCVVIAAVLAYGSHLIRTTADTWLGLLSYALIGCGYILFKSKQLSSQSFGFLEQFLFGDLLLVSTFDVMQLGVAALVVALTLVFLWKPLLLCTLDPEGSHVLGLNTKHYTFILLTVLSLVVAVSIHCVGALLVPGALIFPAACAVQIAASPREMVLRSVVLSILVMYMGMALSFIMDWPLSPTIMVMGFLSFLLISPLRQLWRGLLSYLVMR